MDLWHIQCSELVSSQKVVIIDADHSIEDGCEVRPSILTELGNQTLYKFQVLVSHKISSAPVYDSALKKYVGMFDYRDIADYVLMVFKHRELERVPEDETMDIRDVVRKAITMDVNKMSMRVAAGMGLVECRVDLSKKNPFYSVSADAPLKEAAEILASGKGVHRLNVMRDGEVVGVLSQTDVVKYLAGLLMKQPELNAFASKTLGELGFGNNPVISVNSEAPVLEALSLMSAKGISSVAVVDAGSGESLVGNISMTDIKYILKQNRYSRLWQTCSHFVSLVLTQEGLQNEGKDRFPVFEVTLKSSLGFAMRKIIATKSHRVWIIDEDRKLIGVVTLTDVIKHFWSSKK
ncbi:CBS-domain-containing protein [Rozella allomycis CSF55]|uniref:CBS-domain-containing protein n=1 Tax=Rozella allomycis (strain CSF55) TaxID=988480 RepID=A0A075ANI3_ROZAC|nr:hypothetical protein O9G_003157 [Rozella allomycis CSF55]RKP21801.1 CBS-domain-containing protein [Rozella allomycis CSF55]|eukprot:EPZ31435.1 hypothetical protein O9G_003157 [Rozella allomycis CSF55]